MRTKDIGIPYTLIINEIFHFGIWMLKRSLLKNLHYFFTNKDPPHENNFGTYRIYINQFLTLYEFKCINEFMELMNIL